VLQAAKKFNIAIDFKGEQSDSLYAVFKKFGNYKILRFNQVKQNP